MKTAVLDSDEQQNVWTNKKTVMNNRIVTGTNERQ
jgi:hypothetical protein